MHHLTNRSSSEDALRGIFSEFGLVQTCIVNTDKRHAFVKMLSRTDAMAAKIGMESYKSTEMQLRVSDNLFNLIYLAPLLAAFANPNFDRPGGV